MRNLRFAATFAAFMIFCSKSEDARAQRGRTGYALKTRYTRYTVDGQRFKVLHFRYTGCYNLLHFGPVDGVI